MSCVLENLSPSYVGRVPLHLVGILLSILYLNTSAGAQVFCGTARPNFTISQTANCGSTVLSLTVADSALQGLATIKWGDGAVTNTVNALSLTNKTFTRTTSQSGFRVVRLIRTIAGCRDSVERSLNVIVRTIPSAPVFTVLQPGVCGSNVVSFKVTTPVMGGVYQWNFGHLGASATGDSVSYAYPQVAGTGNNAYTVTCRLVVNGCTSAVANRSLVLDQLPDASGRDANSLTQEFNNCANASQGGTYTVDFESTTTTPLLITKAIMNWGDGTAFQDITSIYVAASPANIVQHTYSSQGVFTMNLAVTGINGCIVERQFKVLNIGNPIVALANPSNSPGCAPRTFTFPVNNWQANDTSTKYVMNWGDGTALEVFNHPPPATVTHMYDSVSCGSNVTGTLNCTDCFGAIMTAVNACASTVSGHSIKIFRSPKARYTVADTNVCVNKPVSFTNMSIDGYNNNCLRTTRYIWNFGTGRPDTLSAFGKINRSFTFRTAGFYWVVLKAVNTCGDTSYFKRGFCVTPQPEVKFDISYPDGLCAGNKVSFINRSNLTSLTCGKFDYDWQVTNTDGYGGCDANPASPSFKFVDSTTKASVSPVIQFSKPGVYALRLRINSPCGTSTKDSTITIKDRPFIRSLGLDGSVCVGNGQAVLPNVGNCLADSSIRYSWIASGSSIPAASSASLSQLIYNSPGKYEVRLITRNECGSDTLRDSVTVHPYPFILSQSDSIVLCEGGAGLLGIKSGVVNTAQRPDWQYFSASSGWISISNGGVFSGQGTDTLHLVGVPVTFNQSTIRVVLQGASGCNDTSATMNVKIVEKPQFTVNPQSLSICENDQVNISALVSNTAVSYQWQLSKDLGATWVDTAGAQQPILTIPAAGIYMNGWRFRVLARSSVLSECESISDTAILTVRARAKVSQLDSVKACVGTTILLESQTSIPQGATGFSQRWQFSTNGGSSWLQVPAVAPYTGVTTSSLSISPVSVALNTYLFRNRVIANGCTTFTNNALLTVNALPTIATNVTNQVTCEQADSVVFSFTASTQLNGVVWQRSTDGGATWGALNNSYPYSGTTSEQLVIHRPDLTMNNFLFRASLTNDNNCSILTASGRLTVNRKPVITVVGIKQLVCLKDTAILGTSSTNSLMYYQWQTNATGIWQDIPSAAQASLLVVANSLSVNGNYFRVIGVDVNGCKNVSDSLSIGILPSPTAEIASPDSVVCLGDSILLTGVGAGGYEWIAAPGLSSTTGVSVFVKPTQNTVYTLIVTNGFGCKSIATKRILVLPQPNAAILNTVSSFCVGQGLTIRAQSFLGNTYKWYKNGTEIVGQVSDSLWFGQLASSDSADYIIEVTRSTGDYSCVARSLPFHLSVHPLPASYTIAGPQSVCQNSVDGRLTLSGSDPGVVYTLTKNGQLTTTTIVGTGTAMHLGPITSTGLYGVLAQNIFGCQYMFSDTIKIVAKPIVHAEVLIRDTSICKGEQISLKGIAKPGTVYGWWLGGSLVSSNAEYLAAPATSGRYSYILFDTASGLTCSDTASVFVTVVDRPTITRTIRDTAVCAGNNSFFSISVASNSGSVSYQWQRNATGAWQDISNANASVLQQVGVLYSDSGSYYRVIITNTSGCTTVSDSAQLIVHSLPTASVDTSVKFICSGDTVLLSALGSNASYFWSGTGGLLSSVGQTVLAKPLNTTRYTVYVQNAAGCLDSASTLVVVNPLLSASIYADDYILCKGEPLVIRSLYSRQGVLSWFKDGAVISGQNLDSLVVLSSSLLDSGSYTLSIVDTAFSTNCVTRTNSIKIKVLDLPNASISASAITLCPGDSSLLSVAPTPGFVTWSGAGLLQNVGHQVWVKPQDTTTYTVRVLDTSGCSSVDTILINVKPTIQVILGSDTSVCQNSLPIQLMAHPLGGTWTGTGVSSSGVFVPSGLAGIQRLTYSFLDSSVSCIVSKSILVNVKPLPILNTPAVAIICSGSVFAPAVVSTPMASFEVVGQLISGVATGFTSYSSQVTALVDTVNNSGNQDAVVRYTLTPILDGCYGAAQTIELTIKPSPGLSITGSGHRICGSGSTELLLTSQLSNYSYTYKAVGTPNISGFSSQLSPTNASSIRQQLQNLSLTDTGVVVYTIWPLNSDGCTQDSLLAKVVVYPKPRIAVSAPQLSVCSGEFTNITASLLTSGTSQQISIKYIALATPGISGYNNGLGDTIRQQLVNSGASQGMITYKIFAEADNFCSSDTFAISIVVNPAPKVIVSHDTICSGSVTYVPISSNVAGAQFTWYPLLNSPSVTGAAPGTGAFIGQTLTNNSASALGFVTYVIKPIINNCLGDSTTTTVIVKPRTRVVLSSLASTYCKDILVSHALSNTAGTAALYSWRAISNTGLTGTTTGSGTLLSLNLSNPSSVVQQLTLGIKALTDGCTGIEDTITLTVFPEPVIAPVPATTVCSGTRVAIPLFSNVIPSSFTWVPVVNPFVTVNTLGAGDSLVTLLFNQSSQPQVQFFSCSALSNGCTGQSILVAVTVLPTPDLTLPSDTIEICSGTTVTVPLLSSTIGAGFVWEPLNMNASLSGQSSGSGSLFTQTLSSAPNSGPLMQHYLVTAISQDQTLICKGSQKLLTVKVLEQPQLSLFKTQQGACARVTVSASFSSGANESLTSFETEILSVNNLSGVLSPGMGRQFTQLLINPTQNQIGQVSYLVKTRNSAGCITDLDTLQFTVYPEPVVSLSLPNTSYCNGDTVTLSLSSSTASGIYTIMPRAGLRPLFNSPTVSTNLRFIAQNSSDSILGQVFVVANVEANGCVSSLDSVRISVLPSPKVVVPTRYLTLCHTGQIVVPFDNSTRKVGTYFYTTSYIGAGIFGALSGTADTLKQMLLNSGTLVDSVVYSVRATVDGCEGEVSKLVVIVLPKPFLQGVLPLLSVCNGDSIAVNLTNGVSGGSFTWSVVSSMFTSGLMSGSGSTLTGRVFSSDSVLPRPVVIKLLPVANGCLGDTISFTIPVRPSPSLLVKNASVMLCEQGLTDISLVSSVPGSSFRISTQVSGSITGASGSYTTNSTSINDQLTNLDPASRGSVVYSITPVSPDGCVGTRYSTTVFINPLPVLSVVQNTDTLCSGDMFVAAFASALQDSIQYRHKYCYAAVPTSQVVGALSDSGATINQLLSNNSNVPQTQSYLLYGSMDSCQLAPRLIKVVVMPSAVVYKPSLDAVCSGQPITLALASNVMGVSFARTVVFSSPNVLVRQGGTGPAMADTLFNLSDTLTGFVRYKLNASVKGCVGPDSLWTVVVKPTPSIILPVDSLVFCGGGVVNLTARSSASPARIAYGAGVVGSVIGAQNGSSAAVNQVLTNTANNRSGLVRYIFSNEVEGCAALPETLLVRIRPVPVVRFAFSTSDSAFCVGTPVPLVNNSIRHLDDTLYATWTWGATGRATAWEPTPVFSSPGRYKIKLIIRSGFGCVDSVVRYVRIIDKPVPRFTASVPASACSPVVVSFTNRSIKPAFEDQYSWFWDFGNGITSTLEQPGSVVYTGAALADTVFRVRLSVRTRCSTIVYTDSVLVRPNHQIAFAFERDTVCSRTSFRIGNMSLGFASRYIWSLGDGRPDVVLNDNRPLNISYNYFGLRDTIIQVRLVAFTACGNDTLVKNVVVRPNRVVALFTPSAVVGCSPFTVSFTSNQQSPARVLWNWADGNTQVGGYTAAHTFMNTTTAPVTYRVSMKAYSGICGSDSTFQDITVWPQPTARFTLQRRRYCVGDTILLTNLSTPGSAYAWTFGNGSTSAQRQPYGISYSAPGLYYIRLTTTSQNALQCRNVTLDSVLIEAKPRAIIGNTSGTQLTVCAGQPISFINNSVLASRYVWRFGTAAGVSTATAPVYAYPMAGRYRLTLEAFNAANCADSTHLWIEVMPKPVVLLSASASSGCAPLPIVFTNSTTQPSALQGAFEWTLPNGSRFNGYQLPPQLLSNASGTQTRQVVKLRVASLMGCVDSASISIDVHPKPVASIFVQPHVVPQDRPQVRLYNRTLHGSQASFIWHFGDGTSQQVFDTNYVDHTYDTTGRFKVVLYVTTQFGCTDSTFRWITVTTSRPRPAYLLNGQDTARGCVPLAVRVSNQSRFATSYVWDFGNGQVSRQALPTGIVYTRPGTYRVKLIARNSAGIDSVVRQQAVVVSGLPVASFTLADSVLILPQAAARFINQSSGATRYLWHFGDGDTSTALNPLHTYKEAGAYRPMLIAYNAAGCADTVQYNTSIQVVRDARIQIPNAFTPTRSEGLNDTFAPVAAGVVNYRMQIFNRWGEEIFQSSFVHKGWDGTYKGVYCLPDTYHYKIEASFSNGERILKIGTLTLIR